MYDSFLVDAFLLKPFLRGIAMRRTTRSGKAAETRKTAGTRAKKTAKATEVAKAEKGPVLTKDGEELLGLREFRREGGDIIRDVARGQRKVAFSTNGRFPQIRLRAAADHDDEVEEVPDELRLKFTDVKDEFAQYRVTVWTGERIFVYAHSERYAVIMDRHPDCPKEIVEARLKRIRSESRMSAMRKVVSEARKTREILERRDARDAEISNALAKLAENNTLAEADRKLVKSALARLMPDIIAANKRRPRGDDLERTLLD
jgi:hypothetical protein